MRLESLEEDSTVNTDDGMSKETPMDLKHDSYYEAIINDDAETVKIILYSVSGNDLDTFLNGKFNYRLSDLEKTSHYRDQPSDFLLTQMVLLRPISLAIAYRSTKVVNVLLDRGVDLFVRDSFRNSIVHVIVVTCYVYRNSTETLLEIYDTILDKLERDSDRKKLLSMENAFSMTPLEISMKMRCYELFKVILYTDGVYRKLIAREGKVIYNRFDFSEYSSAKDRFMMSPIRFLNYIQEDELEELENHGILQLPVIEIWIHRTISQQYPYLLCWMLFRLILPITFIIIEFNFEQMYSRLHCNGNNTVHSAIQSLQDNYNDDVLQNQKIIFGVINSINSLAILSIDIIEFVARARLPAHLKRMLKPIKTDSIPAVTTDSFRICQFLLALIGIAVVICQIFPFTVTMFTIMNILISFQRFLIFYSLLYFTQGIPFIGFFIIGLQKMIHAIGRFIFLFIAFLLLFWSLFKGVAHSFCRSGPLLDCTMNGGQSFYINFLVMLNMVPISDHVCSDAGSAMLYVIHVAYIFLISILMLNYLIAVMSSVYSNMASHASLLTILYQLHYANMISIRLRMLSQLFRCNLYKRGKGSLIINTKEFEPLFKTTRRCACHSVQLTARTLEEG
jgi:hypothetical protein